MPGLQTKPAAEASATAMKALQQTASKIPAAVKKSILTAKPGNAPIMSTAAVLLPLLTSTAKTPAQKQKPNVALLHVNAEKEDTASCSVLFYS